MIVSVGATSVSPPKMVLAVLNPNPKSGSNSDPKPNSNTNPTQPQTLTLGLTSVMFPPSSLKIASSHNSGQFSSPNPDHNPSTSLLTLILIHNSVANPKPK